MIIDSGANECIRITHTSDVGAVRRLVGRRCRERGFDDAEVGRAEIVVQEALRNMVKYGAEGLALVRIKGAPESPVLEFLAVDSGSGMDTLQAMQDGYSTGGSAGQGMGSMARQADEFDVYSQPGRGTIVLCRIRRRGAGESVGALPLEIGAVCTPMRLDDLSGDDFAVSISPEGVTVMVVDGLGHGPNAFEAAALAIAEFRRDEGRELREILLQTDTRMRHSRGGAVSIARYNSNSNKWHAAGIGNVSMTMISPEASRSALVQSGIVGAGIGRISCQDYDWPLDSVFIIYSDGIKSRLGFDDYPGILSHDPSVIAALIHRDFNRGRDDASVVVVKRLGARRRWATS